MNTIKIISVLSLALAACGVKVNGKSYGLGGSSSGGSSSSPASSASSSSSSSSDDEPDYKKDARIRDATCLWKQGSIADPFAGVDGDQPATIRKKHIHRTLEAPDPAQCTAANDHCLRECVWIVSADTDELDNAITSTYDGDRHFSEFMGQQYRAHRTLPATKRLLTPGATVVFTEFPARVGNENQTIGRGGGYWHVGKLDRVDWKAGKVYVVGSPNPAWLSATRVAVLRYKAGGKVQILDGRKREDLVVRKDELFAPLPETATVSDPWSQVKNGQPIVVADTQPFADVKGVCKPINDHCLRPWAWIIDTNNGFAYIGKFDGKTFRGVDAIDQLSDIDGIMVAYRTVPATAKNLKVGAQVFWGAGSELTTHTQRWDTGKVKKIRTDGKVDIERVSSNETVAIDELRVPVVAWYPGEKAEAVQ